MGYFYRWPTDHLEWTQLLRVVSVNGPFQWPLLLTPILHQAKLTADNDQPTTEDTLRVLNSILDILKICNFHIQHGTPTILIFLEYLSYSPFIVMEHFLSWLPLPAYILIIIIIILMRGGHLTTLTSLLFFCSVPPPVAPLQLLLVPLSNPNNAV